MYDQTSKLIARWIRFQPAFRFLFKWEWTSRRNFLSENQTALILTYGQDAISKDPQLYLDFKNELNQARREWILKCIRTTVSIGIILYSAIVGYPEIQDKLQQREKAQIFNQADLSVETSQALLSLEQNAEAIVSERFQATYNRSPTLAEQERIHSDMKKRYHIK